MVEPSTLTLVDDKAILNLEVAAGCGNFGQIFYPTCYLTDIDTGLSQSCQTCSINWFCDAYALPWADARFEHVIMCNPFYVGFNDEESSEKMLREFSRVLINDGKIIVLGTKSNKYVHKIPKMVTKCANSINAVTFSVQEEQIDSTLLYPGYTFRSTNGEPLVPTYKFTINVSKQ